MEALNMHDDISKFDLLPDDAVISRHVTARLLGISEKSVKRHLKTIILTPRLRGNRVGDVRELVRGRAPTAQRNFPRGNALKS
jgi:hypothetical protein